MLTIEPVPAFTDNYIWLLYDAQTRAAYVVDPGDAEPVEERLRTLGLTLEGVLITHHHFDHVGGLAALCAAHNPVVYGPANPQIEQIQQRLGDGDSITLLSHAFDVIEVPGHTLDHIAYFHDGENPLLFCGDTLFAGGCGRVFEGNPAMMLSSLDKLAALPADTRVYCAHEYTLANLAFAQAVEPDNWALQQRVTEATATRELGQPTVPSTIALERATNPFLRCREPALGASLAAQGRDAGPDAVEIFASVRGWKDSF